VKSVNIVGLVRLPWKPGEHEKDRNFLRRLVVNVFLEETPGKGGGELSSKYKYTVEYTSVGEIYLQRPAHLKKGFDFVIHLDRWKFSNGRSNPKHEDILSDLKEKKNNMKAADFRKLCSAIERVYYCFEPEELLKAYKFDLGSNGLPVDAFLKLLKWLFIEQDIRDWNYSGRKMLMDAMKQLFYF
jgi:hypothetical protein